LLHESGCANIKIEPGKYGSLLALVVLFVLATIIGWPYFIQIENITNVMRQASYTGIIALGMSFVIISGGIDLSVGAIGCFCSLLWCSVHELFAVKEWRK